ncbi:pilus assembly PilX family protein [Trichloromonas sp.]|uniref:pilus assembly PilX family protein n=1 Tax=Trichloromonas sp. TaxID=3069249 RepID=UPI003D8188A4
MKTPKQPFQPRDALNNERGVALILALGMIVVISLLGVVVMTVSTREISVSGTYRTSYASFYAADRAVEYALNRNLIIGMTDSESLVDDEIDISGTPTKHKILIDMGQTIAGGGGVLTAGSITDAGPGDLPIHLAGKFGSNFGANFYDVSVTAEGPNNTQTRIESRIVRLFKLDDDSVFIITGGG